MSYATQSHRWNNRLCQSRYEQRNISQTGYSASTVTKVISPGRNIARSAGLANSVYEVVALRSQTAVQGRFWLQGLEPMGFAIQHVAFHVRVASWPTLNRSTYQPDNNSNNSEVINVVQGSRAIIAALSERLASIEIEARAQRDTDARVRSSSRKHAARSNRRKEPAAAARRCTKPPIYITVLRIA